MNPRSPLVYLVLGAAASGRRKIILDLLELEIEGSEKTSVLLGTTETPSSDDGALPCMHRWQWDDKAIVATLDPEATRIFFVTDGTHNPVDQIEAFQAWLAGQNATLARVLCVVDCRLAALHPPLFAWFEACIHFSDVVLLTHRESVENKWLSDFTGHFKKQFLPCLFESVKDGHVKNPALVLEPEARRVSHVFEAEPNWIFTDADGDEIDEQEEAEGGEEGVEAKPEEDPYLARDAAGRRVKRLPDIAAYLRPDSTVGGNAP
ncbi:MAG: hypothetical protein Q8N18_01230 [Opitutaceae bacterium]|nr:hypothetical protein [Opitutaceae bacterium]